MNPSARRSLALSAAIFCAALLQSAFADALGIRGAHPDFLLTTAILGALFCDANGGAALGFAAGLIHASLASPPAGGFGAIVLSRTLAAFLVGWLDRRVFRDNPFIALALVAIGTMLAEGVFFLVAPQPHVLHWARTVVLAALYNTALTLPLYFLLRRAVNEASDANSL